MTVSLDDIAAPGQPVTINPEDIAGTPVRVSASEFVQYMPQEMTVPEMVTRETEFSQAHPYLYGGLKAVAGMVPTSTEQLKALAIPPRVTQPEEEFQKSEEIAKAWRGEYGPEAQAESIVGTGLQTLPLFHLPFAKSPLRATPRDLALVEDIQRKQAEAQTPPPVPPEYATTTIQPSDIAPETTSQGYVEAFQTAKGAATESYADSIWQKVQDGKPIQRIAPLENVLREAQKAGQLKSRDDVLAIIKSEMPGTSPVAAPPPETAPAATAVDPLRTVLNEPPPPPAERPEPPPPPSFSIESPTDAFGTEQTPLANFIMGEAGKLMSPSAAKRSGLRARNPALWEDAPRLSHPTHNKIYASETLPVFDEKGNQTGTRTLGTGGETPDTVAARAYDAGLIPDNSVTSLWETLGNESKSAQSVLKGQRSEAAAVKAQASQFKNFAQDQRAVWKADAPMVPVKDLQIGDTVTVKDQPLKVTDIDPDNYDVTLEDGKKYGVQTVKDSTVIYGEHESVGPPKFEPDFAPETLQPPAAPTLEQAVRSGGTNTPRYVVLSNGVERPVAPFQPVTPEGDIALADGSTVSRDVVSQVLDENKNKIHQTQPGGGGPPRTAVRGAGGEPSVSGLSERSVQSDIEQGNLAPDSLVIGEGWNPEQAQARGQSLLNAGVSPEEVLEALSGKEKFPAKVRDAGDAMAVLQAERTRLGVERAAIQKRFGLGSPEANAAEAAETNFIKDARPKAGGIAQRVMVAFQDAEPVDLGTFDGLYKKAIELNNGETLPLNQKIALARRGKQTEAIKAQETDAIAKRDNALNRLPKVKYSPEEMKLTVENMIKRLTPCR